MAGGIYLVQGDQLVEMSEHGYASEELLQELLAKFPSILTGELSGQAPRRWLLVDREVGLPSEEEGSARWSVDHLFLDQDGVPTIVEVKRSSDTRIRREVVGQMLDYAANAVVYWPIERLRARFEATEDADGRLRDVLGPEGNPDDFWERVGLNLAAGKVRLVFVADQIPSELLRVVEFLNTQMSPADVFAVEVRQYLGDGVQTLVPRVLGQTAEAQIRKGRSEEPEWDEASLLAEIERLRGGTEAGVAKKIIDWSRPRFPRLLWGAEGTRWGLLPTMNLHGHTHWPFWIMTNGTLQLQFQWMKSSPFDQESSRLEFLRRLNEVPGVEIPDDAVRGRPKISLAQLTDPEALALLLDAFEWFLEEAHTAAGD